MSFTGKATYDGGTTLPEQAEDLAPSVSLLAQTITPFLDLIGNPMRPATSTHIEWLEEGLNPNSDAATAAFTTGAVTFTVDAATSFRAGDIVQPQGSDERMLVTSVASPEITVTRGYGGSTKEAVGAGDVLEIIGNAFLEGADAPAARFQDKSRLSNYTQIFMETVLVSGTNESVAKAGGYASEHDLQVQRRLTELMLLLERAVIRGIKASSTPQGSDSVKRTMQGISRFIEAASGSGAVNVDKSAAALTEDALNDFLRQIWEQGGRPNAILVNSRQKRKISDFITSTTQYRGDETRLSRVVSMYESDFGLLPIVLTPHVNYDSLLAVDTTRIEVQPLQGRSFHAKRLADTGDAKKTLVVGEYTCCLKNPAGHGRMYNLGV